MTKIALVTGANKGIGLETARMLKELDYTVVIGARDEGRGQKAAGALNVHFVQLDVTDAESITNAAKEVEERFGRLDVLVNNAGIAEWDGPPSQVDVDLVRKIFETNFYGVISVTNAFIPLLRKSDQPRVVNVSSEVGSIALAYDRDSFLWGLNHIAYPASKTALNMATVQYAKEFDGTPFKFNMVSPGYTATDMTGHAAEARPVADGARIVVELATLNNDGPTASFVDDNGAIAW